MDFSSHLFIYIFMPLSFLLFIVVPQKYKKYYLLAISLFFGCCFSLENMVLLLLISMVNYLLCKRIRGMKFILFFGLLFNLFVLFFFKYSNFMITNLNLFFKTSIPLINLVVPIGLSFITFQNISYLVDAYKGKDIGKYGDYLLYTFYFPKIINGPIIRFCDFQGEISKICKPSIEVLFSSVKRISFGMGKVFILSSITGNVWYNIYDILLNGNLTIELAWLGIIYYSFYLYLNFSGFIDISIGLSKLFNISLPENFDYPYTADSVTAFWRKWHMTLSNWFKEYIYIPLGGNRKGNTYLNIMIVFFLTGIWHGASWNFIIWGIYHGIINVIEKIIRKKTFYEKIPKTIKQILTYFVTLIGWVMFACNGIKPSINYYLYMFGIKKINFLQYELKYFLNFYNIFFLIISILIAFKVIRVLFSKIKNSNIRDIVSGIFALLILVLSLLFLASNSYVPSIYANF